MSNINELKKHRGRIQAQGGGLEKSESWAQDEPLTVEDALDILNRLKEKLPPNVLKIRSREFEKG